jgi:uncharacterized protein DUF4238
MQQRPFASDDKQKKIWRFDKQKGEYEEASIRDTAARDFYYVVTTEDGQTHDRLEQQFSRAETGAANAMQAIRNQGLGALTLGEKDRQWLLALVAISHTRVPVQREFNEEVTVMFAKNALWNALTSDDYLKRAREAGIEVSDEKIQAFRDRTLRALDEGTLEIRTGPDASLASMAEATVLLPWVLLGRRITVLRRVEPPFLLTSDNPVLLQGPDPNEPVGFDTAGVRIEIPLAPDTLLRLTDEKGEERITEGPAEDFAEANRRIWRQAGYEVLAPTRKDLEVVAAELGDEAKRKQSGYVFGGWLPGLPVKKTKTETAKEYEPTPAEVAKFEKLGEQKE